MRDSPLGATPPQGPDLKDRFRFIKDGFPAGAVRAGLVDALAPPLAGAASGISCSLRRHRLGRTATGGDDLALPSP